jgi:hypothetical protein
VVRIGVAFDPGLTLPDAAKRARCHRAAISTHGAPPAPPARVRNPHPLDRLAAGKRAFGLRRHEIDAHQANHQLEREAARDQQCIDRAIVDRGKQLKQAVFVVGQATALKACLCREGDAIFCQMTCCWDGGVSAFWGRRGCEAQVSYENGQLIF